MSQNTQNTKYNNLFSSQQIDENDWFLKEVHTSVNVEVTHTKEFLQVVTRLLVQYTVCT